MSDLERVAALADLMASKGLRRVRMGDLEVEMFQPAPVAVAVPVPLPRPEADEPVMCPCGHSLAEHGAAGCYHGCPDERCVPTQTEPSA